MNRRCKIAAGWLLATSGLAPLVGCQEAPAPAATSAGAAKDAAAKPTQKPKAVAVPAANQPRLDITFDTIKLDIKKDEPFRSSLITPKIHALEGRRVRIRGYLLPSFQQTGLTQFVLVRDNMQCCFGPGAAIYDAIVVEMQPGQATNFTIRPVAVDGLFSVRELTDPDGKALAIYHLDGEAVQ